MSCESPSRALAKLFASLETPAIVAVVDRGCDEDASSACVESQPLALPLALALHTGVTDAS